MVGRGISPPVQVAVVYQQSYVVKSCAKCRDLGCTVAQYRYWHWASPWKVPLYSPSICDIIRQHHRLLQYYKIFHTIQTHNLLLSSV